LSKKIILLLVAACLFPGSTPRAEDKYASRLSVYIDDDATTIISPMVTLQKNIFEETSLNAMYLADIQSCASVDVVSTASPSMGYEETRHSFSLGFRHRRQLTTFGLGYSHSTENDYLSNGFQASLSQELFQRNFTAALNFTCRWDEVGRVNDAHFKQPLTGIGTSISLTQLIFPRVIGQFIYFFEYLFGYQASPYRLVPVADFSVPETHPRRRLRNSFTGRLKESLSDQWFAEQSFRFYFDSWGITGETILIQLYWEAKERLTLRMRYRFHNQNRADFYRESYDALQEYMSRDRELGTLQSHLLGPQVQFQWEDLWIFPEALFDVKVEYFYINYKDYALLENKEGLLIGLGFQLFH